MKLRALALLLLVWGYAYAGPAADSYRARLAGLDAADPHSTCVARDILRQSIRRASAADRAAMADQLEKCFDSVEYATRDKYGERADQVSERIIAIEPSRDWKDSYSAVFMSDPAVYGALAPWLDCGFGSGIGEGYAFAEFDSAVLQEFVPFLPAEMKARIAYRTSNYLSITGDAAVRIPWQELGDRLHRAEDLVRGYPSLERKASTEIHFLAFLFIYGVVDHRDPERRIDPVVLQAWQRFVADKRSSQYRVSIRDMLLRLQKNDNKLTAADEAFMQTVYKQRDSDFQAEMRRLQQRQ